MINKEGTCPSFLYITMKNTFKHSGDLGDIIYSMPTIRALGGGTLYLNPGKPLNPPIHGIPTKKFTSEKPIDMVRPLLEAQDYIDEVKVWDGQEVTFDLDQFRAKGINLGKTNLAAAHAMTFKLDARIIEQQWIFNIEPKTVLDKKVVFHRSPRYHNKDFEQKSWPRFISKYRMDAIFIGIPDEYKAFKERFGDTNIPFYQVQDFLELAQIIQGAELFVGNQSLPFAIAEGLHKRVYLEVCKVSPNCNFLRHRI